MEQFEVVPWETTYDLTFYLYEMMRRDQYKPELIVGIARGGWVPARLLLDFYALKSAANLTITSYDERTRTAGTPQIVQNLGINVKGKRVLIVDDVADSGNSLKLAKEHVESLAPAEVRTATLYYKPWSVIKPEYYVRESEKWIIFPWEFIEFCEAQGQDLKEKGKSPSEIGEYLKKVGIPTAVVNNYLLWTFMNNNGGKIND